MEAHSSIDENMEARKLVEVEGLEDASKKVNIEDDPLTRFK